MIEVMSAITVISVAFSIFFGVKTYQRNKDTDTKDSASQMTLVMYKLDNIDSTVKDIKADGKAFRMDIQDARERILILEQEYKAIKPMVTEIRRTMHTDLVTPSTANLKED